MLLQHRETVLTIVSNSNYGVRSLQVCRHKNSQDSTSTPMRMLIAHMPDIAEWVLNACALAEYKSVADNGNVEDKHTAEFEFLEEHCYLNQYRDRALIIRNRATSSMSSHSEVQEMQMREISGEAGIYESVTAKNENTPNDVKCCTFSNHPLNLMVKHDRESLLQHPLVKKYINYKWITVGIAGLAFYFALYLIFLCLLTTFALLLPRPGPHNDFCSAILTGENFTSEVNLMHRTMLDDDKTLTTTTMRNVDTTDYDLNSTEQDNHSDRVTTTTMRYVDTTDYDSNSTEQKDNHKDRWTTTTMRNADTTDYDLNPSEQDNHKDRLTATTMRNMDITDYDLNSTEQVAGFYNCTEMPQAVALGFLRSMSVMLMLFSAAYLFLECIQLRHRGKRYLGDFENYVQVVMYLLTIVFVHPPGLYGEECWCFPSWRWQIGAVALFLAWFNCCFLLKDWPFVGQPVTMLIHVYFNFFKLIYLPILLILTFGFPLYMLHVQEDRDTSTIMLTFATPIVALWNIIIQTTGELDTMTVFRNMPFLYPILTYILLVLFIIAMPLLFNNFLIGMAVGETEEERKKASLTVIKMKVVSYNVM